MEDLADFFAEDTITIHRRNDIYARARKTMVETQLIPRGIKQPEVLDAMLAVPRHFFVPPDLAAQAHSDFPLHIGEGQTISQPYIVALMTEALSLTGTERVLEIGTGSGYQAAVLSMLAEKVYSIERVFILAEGAGRALDKLGVSNVHVKVGDGTLGWPEEAPFDGIIVTAASPEVPECYVEQLRIGGRLVIPVGGEMVQDLLRITRTKHGSRTESLGGCRFVKLIGKYGWEQGA